MNTETKSAVPESVRRSRFGCINCLWAGIECKEGSKYRPALEKTEYKAKGDCEGYTYYD